MTKEKIIRNGTRLLSFVELSSCSEYSSNLSSLYLSIHSLGTFTCLWAHSFYHPCPVQLLAPLNSPSPFIRANMQTPRSANEQLPLWENRNPTTSYMWDFLQLINEKYNRTLKNYDDLYNWSIECLPQFWEEVWAFTGVRAVPHCSGQGERQNGNHINEKKPFKYVSAIISSLFCFYFGYGM